MEVAMRMGRLVFLQVMASKGLLYSVYLERERERE